jgi:hypothetical protein
MSNTSSYLSIYLIVFLNAACHVMLIRRLKIDKVAKWKFCSLAIGMPLLIMMLMRLMVGIGLLHGRVAEQEGIERVITMLASMMLIAAPFIATGAAVLSSRKRRAVAVLP